MTERYRVVIDRSVQTKDQLFDRITSTAYLGYSSFSGWDAFAEMFRLRLGYSDIHIDIHNEDLSGLSERDRATYLELVGDAASEYPSKLSVS